eukprot:SAG11_NODE_22952_length_397_cov_1.550336_1_plen_39_part_10
MENGKTYTNKKLKTQTSLLPPAAHAGGSTSPETLQLACK